MTDETDLQSLKHRVDRIYHWAWAAGVAAGVLAAFGVKLQFDLKKATDQAKQALATSYKALEKANEAEPLIANQLEEALKDLLSQESRSLDALRSRSDELSGELAAKATSHVGAAWQDISSGIQRGVGSVGKLNESPGVKTARITFKRPFSSVPTVVATPLAGDNKLSDVFSATIRTVTTAGFEVVVARTDTNIPHSWGQELRLSWVAWQ